MVRLFHEGRKLQVFLAAALVWDLLPRGDVPRLDQLLLARLLLRAREDGLPVLRELPGKQSGTRALDRQRFAARQFLEVDLAGPTVLRIVVVRDRLAPVEERDHAALERAGRALRFEIPELVLTEEALREQVATGDEFEMAQGPALIERECADALAGLEFPQLDRARYVGGEKVV